MILFATLLAFLLFPIVVIFLFVLLMFFLFSNFVKIPRQKGPLPKGTIEILPKESPEENTTRQKDLEITIDARAFRSKNDGSDAKKS